MLFSWKGVGQNRLIILSLLAATVAGEAQGQTYRRSYPPPNMGQPRVYQRPSTQPPSQGAAPASVSSRGKTASSSRSGPEAITKASLIGSPGAYVLRDNLVAASDSTTGIIVITASDVTLDLGGFSIRSRGGADPNSCGIVVLGDSVVVRNGSISGFNADNQCGIIIGAGVKGYSVKDIQVRQCDTGILLNPDNESDAPTRSGRISGCSVQGASVGILGFSSEGVRIEECRITDCAPRREMPGEGSAALLRGTGYSIENCSFSGNLHGLRLDAPHSTVRDCNFTSNRNTGLYLSGDGCRVINTLMSANGIIGAVAYGTGCCFEGCSFAGNASHGLALDATDTARARHTAVRRCSFTGNQGDGLSDKGAGGTVVQDCDAAANGVAGLALQATSVYSGCSLSAGGGQATGGKDGGSNNIVPAVAP